MAYRLDRDASIKKEVRRIASERIDDALAHARGEGDPHEAVHEIRKDMKKVRALVRLVRGSFGGYADANAAARDAARRLSELRDAKVRVDTFDAVLAPHREVLDRDALEPIRVARVEQREQRLHAHIVEEARLSAVREDLLALRERAKRWKLDDDGFDALEAGLKKTFGRARDAMAAAYESMTPEAFHEWRKRVKYHRYHVGLLRELWEAPLDALRAQLHHLTDRLGDAHDVHQLMTYLEQHASDDALREPLHVLAALADRRRDELRSEARTLGESLFEEKPSRRARRFRALWRA